MCPLKVNIFNWLVWRDKILSLKNLAARRCNKLPTITCILCHADCEILGHLFRHCQFVRPIWRFFLYLFGLPELPFFLFEVWGSWWFNLRPCLRALGGAIVKSVVWHIWLARNDCMFNDVSFFPDSVIAKVANVFILWFSAAPSSQQAKFVDHSSITRRSLPFRSIVMTPLVEMLPVRVTLFRGGSSFCVSECSALLFRSVLVVVSCFVPTSCGLVLFCCGFFDR